MDKTKLDALIKSYPAQLQGEDGLTVITCPVRLTWVHLAAPHKPKDTNKELRYSVTGIIPPGADINALDLAMRSAWAAMKLAHPPKYKPLKDQNPHFLKKRGGFYEIGMYFGAESKDVPALLGPDLQRVAVDKIYAGCWARLKIKAQGYNVSGSHGVKFWLSGVQFVADDEAIADGATDGFEAVAGASAPAGAAPAAVPQQAVW